MSTQSRSAVIGALSTAVVTLLVSGCQQANAPAPNQTPMTPVLAPKLASQVTWSGEVDDAVTVNIQASKAWSDNVSGKGVSDTVTNFVGALPASAVTTRLVSKSGRGMIEIVQQPTQSNNYTAAVRVIDNDNGSSHYEFTLTW